MLQNLIKEIREISKPLDKDNQPKSKEAIKRALNGILEKIDAMMQPHDTTVQFLRNGLAKNLFDLDKNYNRYFEACVYSHVETLKNKTIFDLLTKPQFKEIEDEF